MSSILTHLISMKIVWWNIFGPHPLLDHSEVYKNIELLSKTHEVLFLGEYNPKTFSQIEKEKILKTHPNFYFFKHKIRPDGVAIFSKHSLDVSKTYFKSSESFYLETSLLGKKLLITHLRHNWHTIKENDGLLAVPKILMGNLFDTGSMINNQTNELLEVIKDKDLIIGDLNTFPSFLGKKSYLYKEFHKIGFKDNIKETTWPNPKVEFIKYPSLTLDQVFSKNKIDSQKISIDGSDHYPISIKLEHQ